MALAMARGTEWEGDAELATTEHGKGDNYSITPILQDNQFPENFPMGLTMNPALKFWKSAYLEGTTVLTTVSTTATIMADIRVWCLVIDRRYNPTFGEPFPVSIRHDDTIHDLKIKISKAPHRPDFIVDTNSIEIWKCKSLKLSAKDSFGQMKKQLGNLAFSDGEDSHVQHLGAAQRVMELQLEDNEILLAVVPGN